MVFKHSMTSAKKRYSHHLIMISIAMNMNGDQVGVETTDNKNDGP